VSGCDLMNLNNMVMRYRVLTYQLGFLSMIWLSSRRSSASCAMPMNLQMIRASNGPSILLEIDSTKCRTKCGHPGFFGVDSQAPGCFPANVSPEIALSSKMAVSFSEIALLWSCGQHFQYKPSPYIALFRAKRQAKKFWGYL
jgi:hypothetical protein